MLFENRFDRRRFRRVIRARRRAVCVDVANVGWTQIAKRHADRPSGAISGGIREMAGIARDAEANDFAENRLAAFPGMLPRLQHEHCSTFGEHQAFSIGAERTACRFRMFVVDRQDAHRFPRENDSEGERGIGATGEDHVRLSRADRLKSLPNRVCTRCARRNRGVRRSFGSEMRRHRACRGVIHRPGDCRRRHTRLAVFVDAPKSGVECLAAAQACADDDAETRGVD